MKKPVVGKIKWKKGKTVMSVNCYLCPDCEEVLNGIGSAGCPHDDNWTYFVQCGSCKLVLTSDFNLRSEDMTQYGWKRVNPKNKK